MTKIIHADTKIGAVHLIVSDLERSLKYYQDSIGLKFFEIILSGKLELDDLIERIKQAGVEIIEGSNGFLVRDPSMNQILFNY